MRILLAEDEEQLARVLKMAMEQSGYQVDAVENGQAAVELSQKNAYDANKKWDRGFKRDSGAR